MSTTLAFRLILGLLVGGVLTCSVWDRNDRELKEQPADEELEQYVAEKIAEIKGLTPEEVEQATWENGRRFFGI